MPTVDNNGTMMTDRSDTNRNTSWWPLIAIPLFFILGWATNDAMADNTTALCPDTAPTTSVVIAP